MKALLLLLALVTSATAQTLRWSQPLPEPTFPADAAAFIKLCQSDTTGTVAFVVQYHKMDGALQVESGQKLFWFSNLGKPLHADEILEETFTDLAVLSVTPNTLLILLYGQDGAITLRKYTRKRTGVTATDTPLPNHEMFPQPAQQDRTGFFVCEKVNNRPAFLKRYLR